MSPFMQKILIVVILFLMANTRTARAGSDAITLENLTYTPLHYRVRSPEGPFSEWYVVLPGERKEYAGHPKLILDIWFKENYSKNYIINAGETCCYWRDSARSEPQAARSSAPSPPLPAPPGAPATDDMSSNRAFLPLEQFLAQCKEQKQIYRLSMKDLAASCAEAGAKGPLPADLRYLRGFTWLVGYLIDEESNDVVLLGLRDPARPPLDIDCLATAIKAAFADSVPSCSLDPHPDANYYKSVVAGVPWNTRWAEVMILADYDMKQLCQGQWDPRIKEFKSHTRHFQDVLYTLGFAGQGAFSKAQGRNYSNRSWFNFNSQVPRTISDAEGKLVYLYKNPVRVSTEQEVNSAYGSGKTTESAKRFANGFTEHMDELGRHYPRIAELQALYRLYDLMRHVREVSQTAPPAMNYWVGQYQHPYPGPPTAMPTLRRDYTVQLRNGFGHETQKWDVQGGVNMQVGMDRRSLKRAPRPSGLIAP